MIELTVIGANRPALVEDAYSSLTGYRWRLDRDGYVMRKSAGRRIYLHHVVLPGKRYPAFVRDHRNRDKLDNRAANLRWLAIEDSPQNRDACLKNPTGFRGVMRIGSRYRATATVRGVTQRFGMFDDP